ncbi:MAG: nucleotidyltransferase family protein [Coriobacteriia bacterium]
MDSATDIIAAITGATPEYERRYGVLRLAVFGSMARGDALPDSDVDVLVEFERSSFDAYMDLKFGLEDLIGRRVDLVIASTLKPRIRDRILAEARFVA